MISSLNVCFFCWRFEVPPIEQKRMVAFINDFIVSTVSFLNQFMAQCDTKFLEFEQKMQKIEASLVIVEAKVCEFHDHYSNIHPPKVFAYTQLYYELCILDGFYT